MQSLLPTFHVLFFSILLTTAQAVGSFRRITRLVNRSPEIAMPMRAETRVVRIVPPHSVPIAQVNSALPAAQVRTPVLPRAVRRRKRKAAEALGPNSPENKARKAAFPPLTQTQKEVLYGMVLGDAYLGFTGNEARLQVKQSAAQHNFVRHLFKVFRPYILSAAPTRIAQRLGDKTYPAYRFETAAHAVFTEVHSMFYAPTETILTSGKPKYVKRVPDNIEEQLTPRVVAYFYMCDGSLVRRVKGARPSGASIASHGFCEADNHRLCQALANKFGLHPTLRHSSKRVGEGKYTSIYFPSRDLKTLQDLLKPYMLKSFYYKLGIEKPPKPPT